MLKPSAYRNYLTLLWGLSLTVASGGSVFADDRDLLRDSASDPYVFILFDTSGSMHLSPQCTQEQYDAGTCDFLCPTGDCFVPLNSDDESSKFRQAKEALYEVLDQVRGVSFGFATYNQNQLAVEDKHWLYHASATRPDGSANAVTLASGATFPAAGAEEVFGFTWRCDDGSGFREAGCHGSSLKIADMNDPDEVRRAQRLPKLGRTKNWAGVGRMADNFDATSFSNNDGTITWATNWIEEDNQAGGAGASAGGVRVGGGELLLTNDPASNPEPAIEREADLSGFSGATLSFDWRTSAAVGNRDSVFLEISADGGASWPEQQQFEGKFTTSQSFEMDITTYISANTRIRFRIADRDYDDAGEIFFVDNLSIAPPGTVVYLRDNSDNERYKFIYRPAGDLAPGAPTVYGSSVMPVDLEVRRCTDDVDSCASSFFAQRIIYYDLDSDFISSDTGARRDPAQDGFFSPLQATDAQALDTCNGWDSTEDTTNDVFNSYNLRWPTDPDPPPLRFDTDDPPDGVKDTPDFKIGDVIPLDWENDHRVDIMERLAPNIATDPALTPEFRVATYLEDERLGAEEFLRLKAEGERTLIAGGATPLGGSMDDFLAWYDAWDDLASFFDQDFNCRRKFLMVLTDGDNTCSAGDACASATALFNKGVQTFVVAFGVEGGTGNTLTCMAANGGTGEPVYPQNKQELVDALLSLFGAIQAEPRAFASASVPTVQNETSDQIYLSSFTPIPDRSVWPGRIDAFRRPLPLNDDNTPDFDRDCQANNLQAGCHLWDAGSVLLSQAPTQAEVDSGNFRIGTGLDNRRLFYSKENLSGQVPTPLRLFDTPALQPDEFDLWRGFGLSFTTGFTAADLASQAAARAEAERIMGETVKIKNVTITNPSGDDVTFTYVLGDIFHSDPRVLGSPNNLVYFRQDLHDYRAFSRKHFWRRKMLAVAANDGMIHFFDAGIRTETFDSALGQTVERFTDGTGKELFAYMPRIVMPIVRDQAGSQKHIYSMDGNVSVADVFIDPLHDGSNNDANDRGWRSVLIGGLREGGDIQGVSLPVPGFVSGYYALDLTQPDKLFQPPPTPTDPDPRHIPTPVGSVLPSCLNVDGNGDQANDADCATPAGTAHRFPTELWTFTDYAPASCGGPYQLDEEDQDGDGDPDGNGERDLGDTWSKPIIGRIRVCAGLSCNPAVEPNDVEDRYVAIFGGGVDPRSPNSASRGAWLYMVDIETGRAIYKRQLEPVRNFPGAGDVTPPGAAAAAPAVIDVDRDGVFDLIYIATTQGLVFKVDLRTLSSTGGVPALQSVDITDDRLLGSPIGSSASCGSVVRVMDEAWDPLPFFWTEGRPIYMTPTVIPVPDLDQFAVAFGTGNRHDLWDFDGVEGRFYTIVDEDYTPLNLPQPKRETVYRPVTVSDTVTADSFLLDRPAGERGWFLRLAPDDKVITQAFTLVGVIVFTSFAPQETADSDGDGFADACARSGVSRVFVVNAENANPFVDFDASGDLDRYQEEGDFTTSPYVDQTITKNPESGSGKTTESQPDDTQAALQEAIRQSLMKFFPESCRFNRSYSLTINASRSDTGHVRFATIPIAMCPVDWKEE